jgi:CheY-like chemotaxis protein
MPSPQKPIDDKQIESPGELSGAVTVLIADDHPVVREGLVALISRCPDMHVVAEASNGRSAVEKFLSHLPNVALLDLRMPVMSGVQAAAICEKVPGARVIIVTSYHQGNRLDRRRQNCRRSTADRGGNRKNQHCAGSQSGTGAYPGERGSPDHRHSTAGH